MDNIRGWLTTIVARICLDALRSRKVRNEHPLEDASLDHLETGPAPGDELELADALGAGLVVVLDALSPPERVAVVLHDMFGVPFEDVARVLGRTPQAARQLASRARRRLRSHDGGATTHQRRDIVAAFLAASRDGDFRSLLELLDPQAKFSADDDAVRLGKLPASQIDGAEAIASILAGRARGAEIAMIDGVLGLAVLQNGELILTISFAIANDRISEIRAVGNRTTIGHAVVDLA